MEQWQVELEERLAKLTEDDAGYQNWWRDQLRYPAGLRQTTLEQYKAHVRFNERDCQQMIEQGR